MIENRAVITVLFIAHHGLVAHRSVKFTMRLLSVALYLALRFSSLYVQPDITALNRVPNHSPFSSYAAPTSSDSSSSSLSSSPATSVALAPHTRTLTTTSHRRATVTRIPHSQPTRAHSIQIPQIPQPQSPNNPALATRTRDVTAAFPDRTRGPGRGPPRDPNGFQRPRRHRGGQRPIIIAFEVLGGIAGAAVLFFIGRCLYNYKKTPKRDRIAEILQRHHLEREMEELERNPRALRRTSIQEPAPPYFPRPPSYNETRMAPAVSSATRAEYTQVATHSPPSSPPPTHTSLPSVSAPPAVNSMPIVPQG
ncbi:unnamed protein product [Cyclocybe aegerita]|uniref:Transmembrane protein n=1 Tax=Cyclocybe aegerita TaxID=1973307 RepID=A0A8S0W710_CYCAE|nr:unnamed protein product [Cyclocybe aegerita]